MVFAAIMLFGLVWSGVFAWLHFRAVAKARAAETWPVVAGKVVSSEVRVEESSDRDGGTSTWYNPIVAYSYSIAGKDYRASASAIPGPAAARRRRLPSRPIRPERW